MATLQAISDRVIKQIDDALGRYYEMHNAKYFDDDKVGKFRTYCLDNGLDDDETIDEEFDQGDPSESLLVDFDDDFPGIDKDDEQRNLKILRILKNCRENETAFMDKSGEKYAAFTVTKQDFIIRDSDTKKTIAMYKEQCPKIFDRKFEGDTSILRLLTVGVKIDKPYLTYLADTFQRERVEHLNQDEINFTVPLWQHCNRHLKELKAIDYRRNIMAKTVYDCTVGAIHSYHSRVCPQVMWYPPIFIQDSLQETCEYLASATDFVAALADSQATSCPFQFDFVFAFNKVTKSGYQPMPGFFRHVKDLHADFEDDDDDDDDDEVRGDPNDQIPYEEDFLTGNFKRRVAKEVKFYDCFGAIKRRLGSAKCLNIVKEVDEKEEKGTTTKKRIIKQQFEEFKDQKMKRKYGAGSEEYKEYPRRHRFCALVDRRKPGGDNMNKDIRENDEVIMYEPPADCNSFSSNKVLALSYFNHSRTCIVPEFDYNKKDKKEKEQTPKEKDQSATITAISPCKGAMVLFSFHVVSADVIRLYMFINGHCIRFMAEDIVKFLPQFFDPNFVNNEEFCIGDRARALIKEMDYNLRDTEFKAFLNKNRSTAEDIEKARQRYNKFILM